MFTDIVMPEGMSGIELAEALRAKRPGLPVILSTGYADIQGNQKKAIEMEFPIILKSYSFVELVKLIRKSLKEGRSHTQALNGAGNVILINTRGTSQS